MASVVTTNVATAPLIALMLAGCSSLLGLDPPVLVGGDANRDGQGPLDGSADAPCTSFSTELDTCQLDFSQATAIDLIDTSSYDSDSHFLTINGATAPSASVRVTGPAGPIEVLLATTFHSELGSTFMLQGTTPVAIIATDAIQIDGEVVVGSGARFLASCAPLGGVSGAPGNSGGGGGGGGAYQGSGGSGGEGDGATVQSGVGETSSAAIGLLAGCPGGSGGSSANVGPDGGAGGGAVDFASAVSYSQSGGVQAGGAGGLGGPQNAGGSGGGSGGMILIESPNVTITGQLAANGGGGGGGAGATTAGHDGDPGAFGTMPALGGMGGSGNGGGSDGASGGATLKLYGSTVGTIAVRGGGGGGGGSGYIAIACPSPMISTASISPPLTQWPP